ncbi:hypothetical protein AB0M43_26795 [Longispora sp. NPDC051575]|uniref:hypothetical protein n=1 Tax=Longispora sp. NPDC051575 TaxID=3154943 RepID=UPI003415C861
MKSRLRSVLVGLVAAVVSATALTLGATSPAAAAFGDETFGCRIAPGTIFTWSAGCHDSMPATTYNVAFQVQNLSGSYTYSWNISGPYTSVITGCTSSSVACAVSVPGGAFDSEIYATVTYSQGGQSLTRYSVAILRARCGDMLC